MGSLTSRSRAAVPDATLHQGPEGLAAGITSLLQETSVVTTGLVTILDSLPNIVFVVKDAAGQYKHANMTLARRLGLKQREDVIGRVPMDVYPSAMADYFMEQDRRVLQGDVIENVLEPQLFPVRAPGWCLTHKRPLFKDGTIHGILSFSRDLGTQPSQHSIFTRLRFVADTIQQRYTEKLRLQSLAGEVDMSLLQLERHFKRVFNITPQQMLTKLRIARAMRLLRSDDSLSSIGQTCGFPDQSAFTHKFKAIVGVTPRNYRRSMSRVDDTGMSRHI